MSKIFAPRLRVAALLCVAGLLTACGGHTDQQARNLPPRDGAGTAGRTGGGTSHHPSDQNGPAKASSMMGSTQDDDSSPDDSGDPAADSPKPKVADGTLTYTIIFTGHGEVNTNEKHNWFDVSRRLQVTSRMHGSATNGQPPVSSTMDALNKKLEACGDDDACKQSAAMSFAMQNRSAMEAVGHSEIAAIGRDRIWQSTAPCRGTANVSDKGDNHWKGWDTELNGRVSQSGDQSFDCQNLAPERHFDGPSLAARMDNHTYTLTLPRFQMDVRYVFGDKAPETRQVNFPDLIIKDVKFTTLDAPLHGSVTLHTGDGSGNTLYDPSAPLTAKVDWTFTPDAK